MGNLEEMNDDLINQHIHDIVARVWAFVDEIAAGRIDQTLLYEHGASEIAVAAIQNHGYTGEKAYRDSIFRHLMDSIGYYELLFSGIDNVCNLSIDEVDRRLYHPTCWIGFVRKQMKNYPLIVGVKESIDYINGYTKVNIISNAIGTIVPSQSEFKKIDSGFDISFSRPYDRSLGQSFNHLLENVPINIGHDSIVILEHGCFISKWQRNIISNDEISIGVSHFSTIGVTPDNAYYLRYITEINDWSSIHRNIAIGMVSLDGNDANGSVLRINDCEFPIYFFNSNGKKYLAIDSNEKITEKRMREVTYSILISIGLLTCNLYLGEYWMVASDDKTTRKPIGLFYSTLTQSVRSDYSIFSTNVYSVLVPAAIKIDPANGEKRALGIIDKLKLSCAINEVTIPIFEKLIENFDRYEPLQRGINILLSGTHLPLEIQPGAFAIALEAICNVTKHIVPDEKKNILNKAAWNKLQPELIQLADVFFTKKLINDEEKSDLVKKINTLNNGFNSDKLLSLLIHYEYPLNALDITAIKSRNTLLHGDINIKSLSGPEFDKLFSLSLRLHKLCCSIPLLMAGYEGYIINNCKLYGFENSCKSFIYLGHKKEKKQFTDKRKPCLLKRLFLCFKKVLRLLYNKCREISACH